MQPSESEILRRTREVHLACRTFCDEGVVHVLSVRGPDAARPESSIETFALAFVRPDSIRFEGSTRWDFLPPTVWNTYALWGRDGAFRSQNSVGRRADGYCSLSDALDSHTGGWPGSSHDVARLLVPGGETTPPSPDAGAAVLAGRTRLGSVECFEIRDTRMEQRAGVRRSIWIGCDDFLIRRIWWGVAVSAEAMRQSHEWMATSDAMSADVRDGAGQLLAQGFEDSAVSWTTDFQPLMDVPISDEVCRSTRSRAADAGSQ